MMPEERLPSWIWVDALIRRAQLGGAACFVLQKGDRERGDVLVKVADMKGRAWGFVPRTGLDGTRIFSDLRMQGLDETEAGIDDYVRRARERDRDLWVLEIEDRDGRHFLEEPVEQPGG